MQRLVEIFEHALNLEDNSLILLVDHVVTILVELTAMLVKSKIVVSDLLWQTHRMFPLLVHINFLEGCSDG